MITFSDTSAGGRTVPCWAPVSTARAACGESCSIGLPPPLFNACKKVATPAVGAGVFSSDAAKALIAWLASNRAEAVSFSFMGDPGVVYY
ncbi:hypothetical protein D3C87_2005440 [compost metagenome]